MAEIHQASQTDQLHLRKVLTLWDLFFYGLVLIQPTAPIPLFGVVQKLSNGRRNYKRKIVTALATQRDGAFGKLFDGEA